MRIFPPIYTPLLQSKVPHSQWERVFFPHTSHFETRFSYLCCEARCHIRNEKDFLSRIQKPLWNNIYAAKQGATFAMRKRFCPHTNHFKTRFSSGLSCPGTQRDNVPTCVNRNWHVKCDSNRGAKEALFQPMNVWGLFPLLLQRWQMYRGVL